MNLFEKMREKNKDRNYIFTAIEKLKTTEEVTQFYKELIEHYETDNKSDLTPQEFAANNVGYILGYYTEKEWKLWYPALDISHPFLGRLDQNVPTAEECFEKGKKLAEDMKEKT